ncbi:MAG TPA: GNAT family N-acetyltransferase [Acidimicrobiales bacterium]|nr:GNAT family N-acetyltransferase [Acidimicrobiales bacterium]
MSAASAGARTEVAEAVADRIAAAVRDWIGGRRVILAGIPVAATPGWIGQLRTLGAGRVLVVGTTLGTGDLPDPDHAEWIDLDIRSSDPIDEFRQFERVAADPPTALAEALDRFDPQGDALVLVAPFQAVTSIGGRPVAGGRRPEWVALEDKTTNDALFDRAGVDRPPCEVVAAGDRSALDAAASRLDGGQGTVWAGDAREGFNGGGTFVRWVTNETQADAAHQWFADRCRSVRVTPFLDGTPCNIHGFATEDGLAVFRPVEAITLRSADPPALHYGGSATFFDPPEADRARMRIVARRVGSLLRDEVGFLGCYTVDGVLTEDGYRPTELNPRLGAGIAPLVGGVPELPFVALHWAVTAGWPCPVAPDELETTIVAAADAHRAGGGWVSGQVRWRESRDHPVVATADGCEAATDPDEANGVVSTGPSSHGGFIRFTAKPEATPVGPPLAPRAAAAYAWADRELGAGIGIEFHAAPGRPVARAPGAARGSPPERLPTASGAVLRRARPSDAEAFAEAVADSLNHLRRWMPWAVPVATEVTVQRDRLVMADASWGDGSDYEFAILPPDEGRIIGGCGLMRRIGPGAIEIGYWVHVDHTRRGHATAAAGALTEAAWALPDVERVEIHCDEANVASAAVPARLGYRLDRIEADEPTAPAVSGRSMIWIAERPRRPGGQDSIGPR